MPTGAVQNVVPTYRVEVPLIAALPEQWRQASFTALGNLHLRVGDEGSSQASGPRAWGRFISTDRHVAQSGTVEPSSEGRLWGVQAGTDLWARPGLRAGLYVAQLDGKVDVNGFARGISNYAAGSNDLRNEYLGAYATWMDQQGAYVDAVLQGGRHRAGLEPATGSGGSIRGHSALASIELGQAFGIAPGWIVEPQLQVAYHGMDVDDAHLPASTVHHDVDGSWMLRLGARMVGELATSAGLVQPYARLNYYRASGGNDTATFIGPSGSTAIVTQSGGASVGLAAGATWHISARTSIYGEVGKLWGTSGSTDLGGGMNASLGLKVQW